MLQNILLFVAMFFLVILPGAITIIGFLGCIFRGIAGKE